MPDLGNFVTLARCSNSQPPLLLTDDVIPPAKQQQQPSEQVAVVDVVVRNEGESGGEVEMEVTPVVVVREEVGDDDKKRLEDYVSEWRREREKLGVEKAKLFLPFLVGAPKLAECFVCENVIYPGEEVPCVVRDCKGSYHLTCAKDSLGYSPSSKAFKCPQHACFACNKRYYLWRCSRCHLASHEKCFAYPEYVQRSNDIPWQMVCWRHADDWPPLKPAVPTNSIEEVFCRLPLPYVADEFKIDLTSRDMVENKPEPPSYLHIRRNIYLVKKKRDDTDQTTGCTDCSSSTCSKDCLCRSQSISCSKACRCSERCTNKPFRKEKKIKIVLTELCGWGVEAAESIKKGEFIVEYVGEVISDTLCEQRLWDMKHKGIKNFYMCEIRKDFTIDATFKGNASRFLNHSCGPNCNLEKWHVDGETRVGVFAARSIEAGEPLTYDYRFVQFGPEVKCHCGAAACQGYLGTKKKIPKFELRQLLEWGAKRRRTPTATVRIIRS
uniref:Histone-lysine N-methyltransferase ASHR3 n=1 Tax=Tanacetum cinerariifolium TaxID=118510 RepID=A0A699GIN0_TANCI|nr:histone-lysine N-methyltransferase ASHR3 [Tanacetum cinerariifolium]